MSTSLAQEPYTRLEIAAGSIAMVAVVLIAALGPRFSPPFSRPLSQPLPQPQELATAAPSNSSASASSGRQWHRGASRAAQEPSSPSPTSSGTTRALAPPNPASAPVSLTVSSPIAPTSPVPSATANDGGARPVAAAQPSQTQLAETPNAPLDVFPIEQTPSARQWTQTREAALAPPATERDSVSRFDARLVQARLHELGYYSGTGGGVWGAASRNALRDFKSMNGLQDDDKWDKETEQRLLSRQSIHAASTFVGGWAPDAGTCPGRAGTSGASRTRGNPEVWSASSFLGIDTRARPPQPIPDDSAPLVRISSRGADTAGAKCEFRSVRRAAASRWQIQAVCSADGQSWNAHVSLTLNGSNLTWSSERGSIKYVRCS